MIFQNFNLLMQRNCLKNICFPLELAGVKRAEAREKGMELLRLVGLQDKALAEADWAKSPLTMAIIDTSIWLCCWRSFF